MKNKILTILFAFATLLAANNASAYYSPSTGRWLSRDPMGEPGFQALQANTPFQPVAQIGSTASLMPSRLFVRDSEDENYDASAQDNQVNLYNFVNNQPVTGYDLMGLCDPLPDSGPGTFDGGSWKILKHKIGKKVGVPGATLTFKVCCPIGETPESLTEYSPLTPPPATLNGNTFPYSMQIDGPPPVVANGPPCLTIVLLVHSTTAWQSDWNKSSGNAFIPSIRIRGKCCCSAMASAPSQDPF